MSVKLLCVLFGLPTETEEFFCVPIAPPSFYTIHTGEFTQNIRMSSVVTIQDPAFDAEVLQSPIPVLVYFWAPWCGPCRLVSPSIEAIAAEYGDRLKVVKMEVDPCPDTVKQYQVEGVPAIRMFQNAELIATYEGAITKPKLVNLIDSHLP